MREHRIHTPPEALASAIKEIMAGEHHGFLLGAKVHGQLIGILFLARMLSVEQGGPIGWIEELYISPAHRQKGIGQALLTTAIKHACALHLVALELEVDIDHKRAESLYTRAGFKQLPRSRWVLKL